VSAPAVLQRRGIGASHSNLQASAELSHAGTTHPEIKWKQPSAHPFTSIAMSDAGSLPDLENDSPNQNTYQDATASSDTMNNVCVIGAGISGLRCVDILLQHNIRVTVLEARDRIGGRARTSLSNYIQLGSLTSLRFTRAASWATQWICAYFG
jgi:hypothetical protein